MNVEPSRLLDISVLAREFEVSGRAVRNWIRLGRVQAVQTPGGRWKITREEFTRLQKIKANEANEAEL
jgi:predicted site-specific integrase-resolvase